MGSGWSGDDRGWMSVGGVENTARGWEDNARGWGWRYEEVEGGARNNRREKGGRGACAEQLVRLCTTRSLVYSIQLKFDIRKIARERHVSWAATSYETAQAIGGLSRRSTPQPNYPTKVFRFRTF